MKAAIPVLVVLFTVLTWHHRTVVNDNGHFNRPHGFPGIAPIKVAEAFYTPQKAGHKRHLPASNDNNGWEPGEKDNGDSPGAGAPVFQPPLADAQPVIIHRLSSSGFPSSHYLLNNRHIAICVFLL